VFDSAKFVEVIYQTTYFLEKSGMININSIKTSVGNVKKSQKGKVIHDALHASSVDVTRDGNDLSSESPSLTPERIAEIVQRISENFYDRDDVLQVVAERILRSPELRSLLKRDRFD
jgi:hypothetical protein